MNKVIEVELALDGYKVYPCYQYESLEKCGKEIKDPSCNEVLTSRFFLRSGSKICIDACQNHLHILIEEYDTWEEIKIT